MAAAVQLPTVAPDSLFTRPRDMTSNMDFPSNNYDLSAPFDQTRRSTNVDGLPTPAPTQRHSHGNQSPPIASSSSRSPFTKSSPPIAADADGDDSPVRHSPRYENGPSPSTTAPIPYQSQSASPQQYPGSRGASRSPPPANPDAVRQMSESPTSYAKGDANEYSEGFRLFPPSPASSVPKPQTLDAQARDVDPEPAPEDDGRPSWDKRQWFTDPLSEQVDPGPLPSRDQQPRQSQHRQEQTYDPAATIRARVDDAQWVETWRGPAEQPWPEPTAPRARAEVRVSGSARAQAQQPTVIAASPPVQQQQVQPQVEEVCIECAMRDQDMADVDVTSPGVWARESDVAFEDLLQREVEEEEAGVIADDPKRPRARGGRLTESNLRLWLSLNPKEPTSKRANLEAYVRSQLALLEAETVARARALHESRQLDDRMRDTFTAIRRSTHDLNNLDGSHGVKLEGSGHGRDVTLLENGLIVEHVDVKREERARRREEKRARGRSRKSSRGSLADVASIYSLGSPMMYAADGANGGGLPSPRPMSVLTAPIMGDNMSGMSGTGSQSMILNGSGMPHSRSTMSVESPNRRTRFFGMRNLSQGFRSSDSLAAQSGFSGSMVDMHVALQRENKAPYAQTARHSSLWHEYSAPQPLAPQRAVDSPPEEAPKKKKKGLAKLWGIVTGHAKTPTAASASSPQTRSLDREEDYPLTPPPPMSYLANRGTARENQHHVSTPSLPTSSMANGGYGSSSTGFSPPSAPSSLLPSPTSSRPLGGGDSVHVRKASGANTHESDHMSGAGSSAMYGLQHPVALKPVGEETPTATATPRGIPLAHMTSEPDMRQRLSLAGAPPVPRVPVGIAGSRPISWRDKMLPPLPGEMGVGGADGRPRTLFGMYDGQTPPPEEEFRQQASRRQSFSGLASYGMQPGASYAEMGISHDPSQGSSLIPPTTPTSTRRKSKFGFGALLGRSKGSHEGEHHQQFRSSGSEARHEALVNVGLRVASPSPQAHAFPRMSMSLASKKNIQAHVEQAPDFVAYRYPSTGTR